MREGKQQKITPKQYMRLQRLLHLFLLAAPSTLGLLAYYQSEGIQVNFSGSGDVFIFIVPVMALACYFGSMYVFRQQLRKVLEGESLRLKLARYQSANIIRYAFLEGSALLAVLAFMQNSYLLYLLIALLLVIYLIHLRPTKERLLNELPLTSEEKRRFANENHILE
ncbi:hypothetical protein WIW50_13055 [Flavobacteriaceae bacterium 3-367]|uniref:hypothetical protein n=1 Tax=Eudoraea algarum TaxID=3417568 RepID=UPI003276BC3F